jgi:hypothetical protein
VRDTLNENPAHLGPAMTALASIVPLHGGIAEECCHLPSPLGCFPGENRDRIVRSVMAMSLVSCLPWKHHFGGSNLGTTGFGCGSLAFLVLRIEPPRCHVRCSD